MSLPPATHWIAAMAFERMLYCLAEGTALAAAVATALRLIPDKNSRTRFAVWFAALAAVVFFAIVPMRVEISEGIKANTSSSPHALVTVSSTVAEYIVLGWAVLAGVGLLRVVASLRQLRRLRRGCDTIDPRCLDPELRAMIEKLSKRRPVSVLVSSHLDVPTAIGFLRPAVLVPAWLADNCQAEELKYVLLHELAHLQRWDDWTNLAQKMVKAVLFFHPGVWWIERKLSLDREMACDDSVLAHTGSPRVYAECLARVAEKSFLRRQIALAQAAVNRVRQLSLRMKRILDGDRPRSTLLWKPAIPMVAAIALLCAVSTSSAPDLVGLSDGHPAVASSTLPAARRTGANQVVNHRPDVVSGTHVAPLVNMAKFTEASVRPRMNESPATAQPAGLKSQPGRSPFVPARYKPPRNDAQTGGPSSAMSLEPRRAGVRLETACARNNDSELDVQQNGLVLLVVTSERISSAGSITWQVNMWELRLPATADHPTKPIPRKT